VVQRLSALECNSVAAKPDSGSGAVKPTVQRNDDNDDDDDDFDLFGDIDEEETAKVLEDRKKDMSKKPSK